MIQNKTMIMRPNCQPHVTKDIESIFKVLHICALSVALKELRGEDVIGHYYWSSLTQHCKTRGLDFSLWLPKLHKIIRSQIYVRLRHELALSIEPTFRKLEASVAG